MRGGRQPAHARSCAAGRVMGLALQARFVHAQRLRNVRSLLPRSVQGATRAGSCGPLCALPGGA